MKVTLEAVGEAVRGELGRSSQDLVHPSKGRKKRLVTVHSVVTHGAVRTLTVYTRRDIRCVCVCDHRDGDAWSHIASSSQNDATRRDQGTT